MKNLKLPVDRNELCNLRAGDWVTLSGTILVARDQAHMRLVKTINDNDTLPVNLKDQAVFYAGPILKGDGAIIGPTTSARMDSLTEPLLKKGLAVMIGKGARSPQITQMAKQYSAVYLMTVGGAAAFLSQFVKRAKIIAYGDLGAEALYRLEVEDFPALVAIDCEGKTL